MEEQDIPLELISSPGGRTPHSRVGPGKGGSRIYTAAKNKEAEAEDVDRIEETSTDDSKPEHQERQGAGQSLTAGDQKSGQAPAEGGPRPSNSVPNHANRKAMKPQEPIGNSMASEVEDPATGNASLKRPPGLTQIAEFWKRYDKLADFEDQKMSKNLNANLDVLLIFAALFSAINTTFISMTMPSLSPDPLDKTNALLELLVKRVDNGTLTPSDLTPSFSPQASSVAINLLLYASLCCSLLAAMGAMLGKEWLQSFDRSGQTGPLEEQGRFRQRKFNGILQWHLEGTILFLPNLLLFSVTLFFAGLALYLFPINKVVAGLLIAVLSFSVGVWQVTVLAGAIWPLCPYQSAASRALRTTARKFRSIELRAAFDWVRSARAWRMVKRTVRVTGFLLVPWHWYAVFRWFLYRRALRSERTKRLKEEARNELRGKEEQISNAQAAFWLIKTTSSWEDRAAAADFITTFDKVLVGASVIQDQGNWQQLLQSTQEAFENWYYQPNDTNRKMVESFGQALSHLALLRPETDVKWKFRAEPRSGQSSRVFGRFLLELEFAFTIVEQKHADSELLAHAALLRTLATTGNIYRKSRTWERLFIMMGDFHFSLSHRQITRAFWNAAHALRSLPESHPETSAFEIYSAFLREIQQSIAADQLPGDLVSVLTYSAVEFMFDFSEFFGANLGSPNLKLDEFSTKALLSLRAILPCGRLPTSSVQDRLRRLLGRTFWSSRKRISEPADLNEFWRALDSTIAKLTRSTPEIEELTVDFVLAAIEWLSISLPSYNMMPGLESFSQIPTFLTLSLAEGNPARQARGLDLFLFNVERWIKYSPVSLEKVWSEVGLFAKLVGMVNEPQAWSKGTQLVKILRAATDNSIYWSQMLVEAGFTLAASEAILHIKKTREHLHPNWENLLRRTLAITLEVWNDTKHSHPSEWVGSNMFLMVRHSSAHMEVSLNSTQREPRARDVRRFVELINHLYQSRSLSAFICCNADVAIRSVFCELRRRVEGKIHSSSSDVNTVSSAFPDIDVYSELHDAYMISQRIDWDYAFYGLPGASVICPRPDFVGTRML